MIVAFIFLAYIYLYVKCSHNPSNTIFTISRKRIMIYVTIFTISHDQNSLIKTTDVKTYAILQYKNVINLVNMSPCAVH